MEVATFQLAPALSMATGLSPAPVPSSSKISRWLQIRRSPKCCGCDGSYDFGSVFLKCGKQDRRRILIRGTFTSLVSTSITNKMFRQLQIRLGISIYRSYWRLAWQRISPKRFQTFVQFCPRNTKCSLLFPLHVATFPHLRNVVHG